MAENSKAILWLDPGLTTGWALLENVNQPDEVFSCGQAYGRVEAGDEIDGIISKHDGNVRVGWEAYIVGHGSRLTGDPAPSLEVIGMTRWLCHRWNATLLPPVPAENRTIATPKAIQHLGWEVKGVHAMDATRHLLAYAIREKILYDRVQVVYGDILERYNRSKEATEEPTKED